MQCWPTGPLIWASRATRPFTIWTSVLSHLCGRWHVPQGSFRAPFGCGTFSTSTLSYVVLMLRPAILCVAEPGFFPCSFLKRPPGPRPGLPHHGNDHLLLDTPSFRPLELGHCLAGVPRWIRRRDYPCTHLCFLVPLSVILHSGGWVACRPLDTRPGSPFGFLEGPSPCLLVLYPGVPGRCQCTNSDPCLSVLRSAW